MTNDRLRVLFSRYVNRTISEDERKEFFDLISKSESDENLKKAIDQLWNSLPDENVHEVIPESTFQNVIGKSYHSDSPVKFSWLKIAAAIGFIAVAAFGLYLYSASSIDQTISSEEMAKTDTHDSFIRLPDGSSVVLNDKSTLKYPDSFDASSTREVYLEGEGYFDIKHNPSKPFIVHAQNVSTTVLGTAFNIKAFESNTNVVVTVTRGKVQVSVNQKILGVLTRDQQITVDKKSVAVSNEAVNSQNAIAWMERDIFFDDVTMEDAMQELENRFNVNIKLANDQLKRCRFTATFVKGEDLDQILLVICEFNKAGFQRNRDNQIEIIGAGCQ